jgi:hypothetical protein
MTRFVMGCRGAILMLAGPRAIISRLGLDKAEQERSRHDEDGRLADPAGRGFTNRKRRLGLDRGLAGETAGLEGTLNEDEQHQIRWIRRPPRVPRSPPPSRRAKQEEARRQKETRPARTRPGPKPAMRWWPRTNTTLWQDTHSLETLLG